MDPHNQEFPKYPPFHTITNNFPPYEPVTQPRAYASEGYGMSGKIMLCAIIILFIVVVIIVGLHIYARWFLTRSRQRQHQHRRRHRRTHLVFTMDISPATSAINRGLDSVILKSLPTFSYSSTSHDPAMECAVCLSEFEDNEKGRLLPKCNHSFHTECIDMWFKSHSTCPLCRAPVNSLPPPTPVTPGQITIDSRESEPGSSSRANQGDDERSSVGPVEFTSPSTSSSSSSSETPNLATAEVARRKFEVSIEIPPRRNESFKNMEEDGQLDSLSGRIRSFKRMLSRDKRPVPSPSPRSRGHIIELDLERGHGDEHRVITPRPYQNSESTTTTPR